MHWLGGHLLADSGVDADVLHKGFFEINTNTTEMKSPRCFVAVYCMPIHPFKRPTVWASTRLLLVMIEQQMLDT